MVALFKKIGFPPLHVDQLNSDLNDDLGRGWAPCSSPPVCLGMAQNERAGANRGF